MRLVHLVDTKFTNRSNFVREAWLIKEKWNKRSCLKPPMNADARRCSAPLIGVDRRASAVPYPRRYEVCSLGPLGGHKVHKMVKFRPRGMVDKREIEQAQLFETADERGCTPMFGAAHRRASAVPYPRRYDVARY